MTPGTQTCSTVACAMSDFGVQIARSWNALRPKIPWTRRPALNIWPGKPQEQLSQKATPFLQVNGTPPILPLRDHTTRLPSTHAKVHQQAIIAQVVELVTILPASA